MSSVKSRISSLLKGFGSLFLPKTSRGRVRQVTVLVVALFIATGVYAAPHYGNAVVGAINQVAGRELIKPLPDAKYSLGLDLQGGTHLVYVADVSTLEAGERDEAMSGVRDVIERRVNAFGVSEPLVQTNKSGDAYRVIVDLAGISDVNQAIQLIGETPILEFKEVNDQPPRELTAEEKAKLDAYNASAGKRVSEVLAKAKAPNADFVALVKEYSEDEETKKVDGDSGFVTEGNSLALDPTTGAQTLIPGTFNALIRAVTSSPAEIKPNTLLPGPVSVDNGTHIAQFIEKRESGKEIEASHILICYKGSSSCSSERSKEEARVLAEKVKAETITANFADKAKEYSDDTSNKEKGGSLGFFSASQMVKPFADAAFALTNGSISDVIETEFGFHIIYRQNDRSTFEYRFRDILIKKQQASDYVGQPESWKATELSGKHLKRAILQFDQNTNAPLVALQFNEEGKKLFGEITGRNINKQVAIFLDGAALSTPVVQQQITEGEAVITGNFSIPEAKQLVRRLNAGALPVPITLETQQTIGASLGQDSFTKSVYAGIVGFLIVAIFMVLYYRLPGFIAAISLLLYVAINLALYRLIPVTLTLSGIAGLVLSLGMAVDANILIFERMKEELAKGRPVESAVEEGFKRAWTSIRDSNFTSLISCAILFYTSSSLIRGFAFTLALGILISMFSAITVSRTLLRVVLVWKPLKKSWLLKTPFSNPVIAGESDRK